MFGLIILISTIITSIGFGVWNILKWLNRVTKGWLVKLLIYLFLLMIIIDVLVYVYIMP